jgi:hypothetical protein
MLAGCAGRPADSAGLYRELSALIDEFERSLAARPARAAPIFGGEVLAANSHRGEALLTEQGLRGSVVYVDALKALGAGGVTLQAGYPLLADDYPRSAEYWAFYRNLAQAVKSRGLKLHVKQGPLFTEKEFTSIALDYSRLTPERYFAARTRMAQRAAEELAPDYLTIGNEPSSEMHILRFRIDAERYTRFANDTLQGIKRGTTSVGAGSGTWDSLEYIRRFANDTALDYIDLHLYPLAGPADDYMRRALDMAAMARAARKRLIVGEAWLYKAAPRELRGNPSAASIFARDVHSYWAPLDIRYLQVLRRFAEVEGAEYVSPFWTKYLFAYLDPGAAPAGAGAQQLLRLADQAAAREIVAGRVSASGAAYRRLAQPKTQGH